jgi:hypothetical protein
MIVSRETTLASAEAQFEQMIAAICVQHLFHVKQLGAYNKNYW